MTGDAPRWVPGERLEDCDGAAAPYQRVAGGAPLEGDRAAMLRGGGDALWRVALAVGLLAQRVPAHPALPVMCAPPAPARAASAPALPEDAVAIGVVDGPVAFAHAAFRLPSGASRLDWLWLQDAPPRAGADAPFGRELLGPELNALLGAHACTGGVDEEALYRAVGHLDMARPYARDVARVATHGAAVLGLAAGGARPRRGEPGAREAVHAVDARPEAFPLLVAALPAQLLGDTSGAFNALHVVLALDRMLRRAASLGLARGCPLPVAVSISLGLSGGPKDGSGLLARYIDAISDAARDGAIEGLGPCRFALPVGNERQSRLRARLGGPLGPEDPPLWWRLPPDDGTPSFLEFWSAPLPERPPFCPMDVGLQPPGHGAPVFLSNGAATAGPEAPELEGPAFGGVLHLTDLPGAPACAYVQWLPADPARPEGPGRARVTLAVPPTRPEPRPRTAPPRLDLGEGCARPGDWRLFLAPRGDGPSCFPCDLHVQRDDSLDVDRPRGRQSWLVDPAWRLFDARGRRPMADDDQSRVLRSGTISAYATAGAATLAGGRVRRGGAVAPYSSDGEGRDVTLADTDESLAMSGMRVIGARSGGFARYAGSSMAAPLVARDIAAALSADARAAAG